MRPSSGASRSRSAAFDLVLAYIDRPRTWTLVLASGCATGAVLSRPPLGAGPVIALGLLALASLSARGRTLVGFGAGSRRGAVWVVVAVDRADRRVRRHQLDEVSDPVRPAVRSAVRHVRQPGAPRGARGERRFAVRPAVPADQLACSTSDPTGSTSLRSSRGSDFPAPHRSSAMSATTASRPTTSVVTAMPLQTVLAVFGTRGGALTEASSGVEDRRAPRRR